MIYACGCSWWRVSFLVEVVAAVISSWWWLSVPGPRNFRLPQCQDLDPASSDNKRGNHRVSLVLIIHRPARNGRTEKLLSTRFPRQIMCVRFNISAKVAPSREKSQYMSSSMATIDDLFRCMMSPGPILCAGYSLNGDEKCHFSPSIYDFFHDQ